MNQAHNQNAYLVAGPRRRAGWVRPILNLLYVTGLLTACVRHAPVDSGSVQKNEQKFAQKSGEPSVKVGLVLDKGGRDDKSFNSAAFEGATRAARDLRARVKTVESSDDSAFEPALRAFAERGFPLVIGIGFAQADALKKVAPDFPDTHFAIVDGKVDLPNVANLFFAEHEGSYLVGYLAGLATKTGKVGFVGGMDIPLIRRFQVGYEAGVRAARPAATVFVNYVGINSSAWANPARGKELAVGQYERGADVIFPAAGASGLGVFDAAEEKRAFVIGVDSNQNCVKPGRVLSSMLKRVDTAVYNSIADAARGRYASGVRNFGLADKGVDYAVDDCNRELIAPYRGRLEEVRGKILSGEIKVPDYYETNKIK